jgi:hypothetical protein
MQAGWNGAGLAPLPAAARRRCILYAKEEEGQSGGSFFVNQVLARANTATAYFQPVKGETPEKAIPPPR